ncbi:MAG: alpha/beta fold hydrolase [Polyangiales bacterium]
MRTRSTTCAFTLAFAVSLAGSLALTPACSEAVAPPSAPTTAYIPAPIPTTGASGSTSSSASTAAAPPRFVRPKSSPSMTQLLNVHRALNPQFGSPTKQDDWYFLGDDSGMPQLYAGPAKKDDKPTPVPGDGERVRSFRVAPDGRTAAVLGDVGGDEDDRIFRVTLAADKDEQIGKRVDVASTKKVRHTLPSFDDRGRRIAFTSNARNGRDMDLYVGDWAGKAKDIKAAPSKPLAELTGSFGVSDFQGEMILLHEDRSEVDHNLWLVDAKSGKKELLTKHEGDQAWSRAEISADGKSVFALTDAGRDFVGLVKIDLKTKQQRVLYAHEHDVADFALSQDLAAPFGAKKGARATEQRGLIVVNVDGFEEIRPLTVRENGDAVVGDLVKRMGDVGGVTVTRDGTRALASMEDATTPTEVFSIDLKTNAIERVTHSDHAGVDESKLVPAQLVTLKASDGVPLSYFWYPAIAVAGEPAGLKRPVIVIVHGGPEAQAQPIFSGAVQAFCAAGFDVATPNVRGSMGYGKAFSHLDDKEKRQDSVRDLSEIGRHLAARPDVDGARIALYGGSYGGYMVLAGLTLYPDQWAAGVDIVGIANFKTFLEQTKPYRRALREAEYGSLASDAALLEKISPIHSVDKIKAPLFVIHGANDPRVPLGEATQVFEAVKARGIPVDLLVFENEGHGIYHLENKLKAYPAVLGFLEKWVRDRP